MVASTRHNRSTKKTTTQSQNGEEVVVSSFSLPERLFNDWKQRLPHHGDRSRVLQALIQKFLKGETQVIIETPPRQI